LVLKKIVRLFLLFTWNIDLVYGFGGRSGWYLKEIECHYVYDLFGHRKVIGTTSSIKLKIFWLCKDFFPFGRLVGIAKELD
jgi:hypothetical protein